MRTVMLCFALMAGWAFGQDAPAQNPPEKAVRTIRDVQPGMSRDHVLSGLSELYEWSRIDADPAYQTEGAGYWGLYPKYDPKRLTKLESGTISFWEGKVRYVTIDLYPSMTGEAPRFAARLFRLLYDRADPPTSPTKLQKLVNVRYATLPVELHNERFDEVEELTVFFTVGGQDFRIRVKRRQGEPDRVDIEQQISGATTNQK